MQYYLDSGFRVFYGLSEVYSTDIKNWINLGNEITNFTFNRNLASSMLLSEDRLQMLELLNCFCLLFSVSSNIKSNFAFINFLQFGVL